MGTAGETASSAFGPAEFQAALGVSRETTARLQQYADILRRWQQRVNLVGRGTVETLWFRHLYDSAQLYPMLPPGTERLIDLGSGAGLPGLVLAVLGVPEVHLVDSDHRKCAFLTEAARHLRVTVTVHARRIEDMPPLAADVVTARALAPLGPLIRMARPFVRAGGTFLVPKGQDVDRELTDATKSGMIPPDRPPERFVSRTDPRATILRFGGHSLVGAGTDHSAP